MRAASSLLTCWLPRCTWISLICAFSYTRTSALASMQFPITLSAEDQDFMPNKRPRTLCKGQDERVQSSHARATACKTSSFHNTGKENQPPTSQSSESGLQPTEQQEQASTDEILPLRVLTSSRKSGSGSLLIRSFFTKAKHMPTSCDTAAHSSTIAGSSAEPPNHQQKSSQSSTTLVPHHDAIACAAGTAHTAGTAVDAKFALQARQTSAEAQQ